MIADKYLQELVNRDEGKIAQLINMDGRLAETFQRFTAEHEEIRNYLLQVIRIRDRELYWGSTSSRLTGFEKQCRKILKELEENELKTVARAHAGLFIASLMGRVAKVRAELFVTSLIDRCLYRVLVDDCGRGQGEPRRNEEKYQRIWNQFRYIKHIETHGWDGGQIPPWWWLCENRGLGEDTQFLKDHKALIAEIAREYWEDFLKNVVVEDKEEVVKKIGQSFFGDIRNPDYPEQVRKLIEEILKCAGMLLFGRPPIHIPRIHIRLEDLA